MRILTIIAALFWASLAQAEPLRIASWNIEHLVASTDSGCRPRSEADFQRVRDVIADVDADIWLLQEIEGEAALARVFDTDDWVVHVEDRRPRRSYPECRHTPGQHLSMQATAIVLRAGIAHRRLPDLKALDVSGRGSLRHGVLIELTGPRPLTILNTHLKSGCFEGAGRQACGDLFAQLPVLRDWYDAQNGPVLIGGDLNRRLEVPNDTFWAVLNEYNDLHIAGAGIRPNCLPQYREFIDFLILNDDAVGAKLQGSFAETTFSGPIADYPSDHCPVAIDIDLGKL
ncbi:endonuclease/exonuclease/phosphatase family protein [Roseinatronobacter monicus]|uniref:Endonuclease/exonuclease/phosphatase family metal-dependent hydrolase n=1 Tax=Roseinatronobacter monicus TaxID=393481 RepID=A0A543K4X1_9RHOB|nr:endonuclease/exonuclease/phosphatase family protein [Roseinatronobacter monicus]TQM90128.1 endonuclease/exonuclease/phosphatase family metal-dependent hydrolase [Roseinatronobacter monicus]